jgi:phosphatidylserine/phosphatidylglycerophosphate/cardiolipin synthase-like enzyme
LRLLLLVLALTALTAPRLGQAANEGQRRFASEATYQVCFTPSDDCEGMIVWAIGAAARRIHVQAYSFTDKAIARALEEAARRELEVVVLLDKKRRKQRSSVARELLEAGVSVLCDVRPAIAHNTTLIIDPDGQHPVVETGSFNFSYSAEQRNAENALILRDDQSLAAAYERYFQERLAASEPW